MIRTVLLLLNSICLSIIVNAQDITPLFKDKEYLLIVTIGPDCPISQKYVHTLKEIYRDYQDNITFLGIVPSNFNTSAIHEFKETYSFPFTLERDEGNQIITQYSLHVTPEVVVVDRKQTVQYQGAIDNWFYELGRSRIVVSENYLTNALGALLSDSEPQQHHTKAIGCLIEPL